jgi:hypothetical protein
VERCCEGSWGAFEPPGRDRCQYPLVAVATVESLDLSDSQPTRAARAQSSLTRRKARQSPSPWSEATRLPPKYRYAISLTPGNVLNGRYGLVMRCSPGQNAASRLLPGFDEIPITELFRPWRSADVWNTCGRHLIVCSPPSSRWPAAIDRRQPLENCGYKGGHRRRPDGSRSFLPTP